MKTLIRSLLPTAIRKPVRDVFWKTEDAYWRLSFGGQSKFVPPVALMHDGPQSYKEFKKNGEEFLRLYKTLCGLKPEERILDVGSGIGRKTLPLIGYLSDRGSYDGLELVQTGVDWCTAKYTSRFPNFKFHLIDVFNEHYNPTGKQSAATYRFPFADREFDFVVLNSVFTHMLPPDVENYITEVARVLKVGGRCLISFLLLNEDSSRLISEGKSTIALNYQLGPARIASVEDPEGAIGYDQSYVMNLYEKAGLAINETIYYGSWCGREKQWSYQDQIVAVKN